VKTPTDIATRVDVVRRRDAFERDPTRFHRAWAADEQKLRRRIAAARRRIGEIEAPDSVLEKAAQLCVALGADGLRGELTLLRAARALAAFEGETTVGDVELRRVAPFALGHRLRRNPLDETGSAIRVERAIQETFGP
jgi:magnesium chelatase subunit I